MIYFYYWQYLKKEEETSILIIMLDAGRTLLKTRGFEFQTKHLLIIAVLAIAFSTAFIMRSYLAKYGLYLNEFDPYFDYRATNSLLRMA